ncbi:hypothetical protein EON80_16000 [bacterium]|nr:MAG: hypothetical protein EON80_16000 [bacterium]
MSAPPPWKLRGEAVALLAPSFRLRLLVNYHESPVGPYREHALVSFGWRGPSVTQMSVDSLNSVVWGRRNWGFPKVFEPLRWVTKAKHICFERSTSRFRIRKTCLRFPLALPFWTIQNLDGRIVRVPATLIGQARIGFRGRQIAIILDEFDATFLSPVQI